MSQTGVIAEMSAGPSCVTTVRKALNERREDIRHSRANVAAIAGDLAELQRRLACLREISTRYNRVTLSDEAAGLMKMAGSRTLVDVS